jgi:hypothetical protein
VSLEPKSGAGDLAGRADRHALIPADDRFQGSAAQNTCHKPFGGELTRCQEPDASVHTRPTILANSSAVILRLPKVIRVTSPGEYACGRRSTGLPSRSNRTAWSGV